MSQTIQSISFEGRKTKASFSIVYLLADFVLANIALLTVGLVNQEVLYSAQENFALVGSFYIVWLATSLLTKKFHQQNYRNFFRGIIVFIKCNVLILYCIMCLTFVFGISDYSHLHIFETLVILFLFETILLTEYNFRLSKDIIEFINREALRNAASGLSIFLFSADFLLFTSSFFLVHLLLTDRIVLDLVSTKMLLILYALWLTTSMLTRKFEHRRFRKIYQLVGPNIKAILLTALCFYSIVYLFGFVYDSNVQVLGTLGMSLSLGVIPNAVYSVVRLGRKWSRSDIETVEEVKLRLKQEELDCSSGDTDIATEVGIKASLRDTFLNSYPELYRFIDGTIDLSGIYLRQAEVLYSNTSIASLGLGDRSCKLLLNLDRVNDIRSLNRYFLDVHGKLANGGIFVCQGETIETHRRKFMNESMTGLSWITYLAVFFYRRMLPRIPGLKLIYFAISRGRNRVISRAEFLGRLYFCGFKVLAGRAENDRYYVIAQKVKTPSRDTNPSNDLFLRLNRVGHNGEMIQLIKFRTMFPYSEYLQEYVYQRNKLQANGKFKKDFRITEWGNLFRKFWIDELPQFVNYFRGELNIVGVRALSKHYFELYPKELQELRIKFKPGLIPPYYYDLPKSFEEIVASEIRYLQQKQLRPMWTDVKYFTVALYNIFLRGARSK